MFLNSKLANIPYFFYNFIIIFCLIFLQKFAFAVESKNNNGKKSLSQNISITADHFYLRKKEANLDFVGNVTIAREEVVMKSSKMLAIFSKESVDKTASGQQKEANEGQNSEGKGGQKQNDKKHSGKTKKYTPKLLKIISNVPIKIFTNDSVISADRGYYNHLEKQFILEGNVLLNNGTSVVSGNKFIYDLATKKGRLLSQFLLEDNKNKNLKINSKEDSKIQKRAVVIINDEIDSEEINDLKEREGL
jgi:lipopolysaccharide export system protein LptA